MYTISSVHGPVSQRVAINRTMDINRSSMANHVELAINETGALIWIVTPGGKRIYSMQDKGWHGHRLE